MLLDGDDIYRNLTFHFPLHASPSRAADGSWVSDEL